MLILWMEKKKTEVLNHSGTEPRAVCSSLSPQPRTAIRQMKMGCQTEKLQKVFKIML